MFEEFKDGEIVSINFTCYPTRSIDLTSSGPGTFLFERGIYLNDYSEGYQFGLERQFIDVEGNFVSQSFSTKSKGQFICDVTGELSASNKKVINTLRNIYASKSFVKDSYSVSTGSTVGAYVTIPSFLIGSGIKPGSFSMNFSGEPTSNYTGSFFMDDGYGGLVLTNQLFGVGNVGGLVGVIFYEHGIIAFNETIDLTFADNQTTASIYFSATNHTPMNVYLCNASRGQMNFSTNPSYTILSGSFYETTTQEPKTFVTSINLYDKNYELIGTAKLGSPILLEEARGVQFRLKLNF